MSAGDPGLSEEEARARLLRDGPNDLPSPERHSAIQIVLEVLREPMFAMLLAAGLVYGLIGDLLEALVLFAFASISVLIAIVQRGRSEKVLEALRDLTSPRALVIRDGERRRIAGRDVVRGDAMVLSEGDRVPADALLISGEELHVDESLLTGESAPARKRLSTAQEWESVGAQASVAPGGDDLPNVYSGTLIVRGSGIAIAYATGASSEIGKIGRAVGGIVPEPPRLQIETRRLVVVFAWLAFALSSLVVLLYGFLRGDWLHALLGGIALGMSLLPEEFPLVLTVFMVMGAWRLSKSQVLTRRAAAIETLGSATVLCTDKTGTLTRNAMSIVCLQTNEARWEKEQAADRIVTSHPLAELLRTAMLASDSELLDPMERAIHELVKQTHWANSPALRLVRIYPLSAQRLAVTRVWASEAHDDLTVAAKGAPEAIARLCNLTAEQTAAMLADVDRLAGEGIRVLAAAAGTWPASGLPDDSSAFPLRFKGLLGFADPLRPSARQAVHECREAGIRVLMITGDYPVTARAIAGQAGIEPGEVISGAELEALDEAALAHRIHAVSVFARITPQQKLRIVNALKASGEIVAMTGDGVNDAPALKAAHIGIAMGGRGTDVAREAASLVLLDDDFGSIVHAVRLGRRIYDNLRKAMGYVLAMHVPIVGLALLPIAFGWPLVLTPMLIAFLELVIDPSCSVVLEAEPAEKDVMRRRPRDPDSALITRSLMLWSFVQGTVALALVAGVFFYAMHISLPQEEVRALAFASLVAANVALVFVNRTFDPSLRAVLRFSNRSLWVGLCIVVALLSFAFGWRKVAEFLNLGPLHVDDVALILGVGMAVIAVLQGVKSVWGRKLFV